MLERIFSFRGCPITCLVTLVLIGLGSSASAQTRPPALQKLIEEAKKEGALKLQWLGGRLDGDAGLRPMVAALNKMYGTNLKLQYTPGPDFPTLMVFDCGHDDAYRYQKRGGPVGHVTPKEIARINLLYMGVPVHAEHPSAAALFINFMNTREGQALQWEHARHDLHIYPEANTRKPVQRVVDARGKLALDSVERELSLGHEEVNRIRDEFVKILKERGK